MISVFERSALVFLAGVVVLAVGGAVFLHSREAPKPVSTPFAPRESLPARTEPLPAPAPRPADASISYDLEAVAAGAPVPRVFATALPETAEASDTRIGREDILRAMLPLVLLVNEEILTERRQLWSIRFKRKRGDHVPPEQQLWLRVVAERYGAAAEDLDELLRRMDVVPPSIVLAVASEELERERHEALGKERKAGRSEKAVSAGRDTAGGSPSSKHVLDQMVSKTLPGLARSPLTHIRAIIQTLNTGSAYENFRTARARMRLAGEPLDSLCLARELPKLQGRLGPEDVAALITTHSLNRFDAARLQPTSPSG
jgi:Bax protein